MATTLEEAFKTLQGTDNDHVQIDHLDDGRLAIYILPQEKTVLETEENSGKSKWAKFAEKMHKESPLRGQSEKVNGLIREFKDDFSFDRD